jgi:polysaccharide chain length determinant protein (PEP-CTERM system associated)
MLPGKKYSMRDIGATFKRRWWLLVTPALIGLFCALLVSSRLPDVYQSEMLIQIVPQRVPASIVQTTVPIKTEDRMDSLGERVKSRAQLERLITELNLYPAERTRLPMEDLVGRMRSSILVDLVRPGRYAPPDSFYVRFTYGDPEVAARVTSRLGSVFVDQNAQERMEMADGTTDFLSTQLAEAESRLRAHEKKVEAFTQAHSGRLPTQSDFNLQVMQTTQSALTALVESTARDRDRKQMLERFYNEALAEPLPVPPPAAAGSSAAESAATAAALPLEQQLEMARALVTRLQQRLTPEHPDLRRAQQQVQDLTAQIAAQPKPAPNTNADASAAPTGMSQAELDRRNQLRERKVEIDTLSKEIVHKEREQERLRGVLGDYQRRIEATPGVASEWLALNRDYETLNANYKSLLQRREEAKMSGELERRQIGERFRVVDHARVAGAPIAPVRFQISGIGLGIGIALGLLVVAFLELRDTTFRTENDVMDVLALPVLALVPFVEDAAGRARRRRRMLVVSAVVAVAVLSSGYLTWSLQLWRHIV